MKINRLTLFICIAFIFVLSCEYKDTSITTIIKSGTYKGQFIRNNPYIYSPNYNIVANVTLVFNGNKFSGESDKAKYPAICNGTFNTTGQEINFENLCVWTADFDWSIILAGKYQIKVDGNKLSITRPTGDSTDIYNLVLQ